MENLENVVTEETVSPVENMQEETEPKETKELTEEEKKKIGHDTSEKYHTLLSLIHSMEDQYNEFKKSMEYFAEYSDRVKKDILYDILPYSITDIKEKPIEELDKFVSKYKLVGYKEKSEKELRDLLLDIKNNSINLYNFYKESLKNYEDSNDILRSFISTNNSVNKSKREKKIIESLEKSKETASEESKKKIDKTIDTIHKSIDYSFIYTRLDEYGAKEVERLMDGFFSSGPKGGYIMNRFKKHIKYFGYDPNIFSRLFNLEETFLSEEYAPFNNLFLYVYITFVSYANRYDDKDKLFVSSITNAMADLIYHNYPDDESKNKFLDVIMNVDNRFLKYKDRFIKENWSYKNHEHRKVLEEEKTNKLLKELFKKFYDTLWITDPKAEFPDAKTFDDFKKEYDTLVDKYMSRDNEYMKEVEENDKNIDDSTKQSADNGVKKTAEGDGSSNEDSPTDEKEYNNSDDIKTNSTKDVPDQENSGSDTKAVNKSVDQASAESNTDQSVKSKEELKRDSIRLSNTIDSVQDTLNEIKKN